MYPIVPTITFRLSFRLILAAIGLIGFCHLAAAQQRGVVSIQQANVFTRPVPDGGRENLFALSDQELQQADRSGRRGLLQYAATDTTLSAPYNAISRLYQRLNYKPLVRLGMRRQGLTEIGRSWSHIYRNAGLVSYPPQEGEGAYFVPFPQTGRPSTPIGFSIFRSRTNTPVFTLSCASCHTRNLFGRPVLGGTNLTGGTGNSLTLLKKVSQLNDFRFRFATAASGGELAAFHDMQRQSSGIHGLRSQAMGLENPVAFVGLTLVSRSDDPYASRNCRSSHDVSRSPLHKIPTDTKAPVLWNLKYKNRFQHDGSMSGDPILANLIFNEIGRGADLRKLESWINRNRRLLRDMSASAYAMEAPRWTDFFAAGSIDVAKAKRGQRVFRQLCSRCHGTYIKAWDDPNSGELAAKELLATVSVNMPSETRARNVGTDPSRSMAMEILAPRANRLAIFKNNQISFQANPGAYVPPPLVGIWARWPYMHNNAIPTLDQLLAPSHQRVTEYYVGAANDPKTDYDTSSVGFPLGNKTPRAWRTCVRRFDTRKPGLSNTGHDEGIFLKNGVNQLTGSKKSDLIEFLKTL